jgi:putative ABC transport system ATP-binding protein
MPRIPVIKATNLTKEFELGSITVKALNGVNLEIYSGEFVIFFGPSGCGKSTLMSMIAGLQPPSNGEILIRGEDLSKLTESELADHRRSKIGMVFQSFNLIPTMNIVENIALPLAFARIPKKRRFARAENLLEVVGMSEYKKHNPTELSGGQQQRIAIARSLVANPWIILADEPTGNLDSKSANEVMRLLISLNRKSKRTIVLITHNPEYVDYADRIFYLRDGKVVDIKVNSKVKRIEEVESVGKLREDLAPGSKAAEADKEDQAKELVENIGKEKPGTKAKEEKEVVGDDVTPLEQDSEEIIEEKDETDNKKGGGLAPIKLGKK